MLTAATAALIITQRHSTFVEKLMVSGRDQLTWGTTYDPTYTKLKYPGGDVDRKVGVCTDVVIRAYRSAGVDLQKLIIEHKRANPRLYPQIGKTKGVDPNIDHRRCRNQIVFFKKHARSLPLTGPFAAGDLVYWKLPGGLDHVGLVSDQVGPSGKLMVFHNISTPKLEDVLGSWTLVAHFRYIP